MWNNFCVISLKTYTKKTKSSKLYSEITYLFQLATSKTWTGTLDSDPQKPTPLKIRTQNNLDPENHGPKTTCII